MEPLIRSRLRDEIAERLATLIAAGELGTERLKEVELAGQLGVSRTPLREALLMLEREGLVVSEVNKGFRVAALSEARVRELYPILGALEGLCVREAGERLRARAREPGAVNAGRGGGWGEVYRVGGGRGGVCVRAAGEGLRPRAGDLRAVTGGWGGSRPLSRT